MSERYKKICEKLGFDLSEYDPPVSHTEDDRRENPFLKLTLEENMYLYENGYLDQKKKK